MLLSDPAVKEPHVEPIGENSVLFSYVPENEEVSTPSYVNVVLAAFTTANARLKLLESLELAGDSACYCDTDSIFHIVTGGCDRLDTGEQMGDLVSEISAYGDGSYISEFCAGGAKNYSFRVRVGGDPNITETVIKVRGLTCDKNNVCEITHENLQKLVVEGGSTVVTSGMRIKIHKDLSLETVDVAKTWRTCHEKRRMLGLSRSLPFGYVD